MRRRSPRLFLQRFGNMDKFPFFKTLAIVLLATTYCKCQPVEFLTETVDTTICPEELAKKELESSNLALNATDNVANENVSLKRQGENNLDKTVATFTGTSDQATTICPEELERQKIQDGLNEETDDFGSSAQRAEIHVTVENTDGATTFCPEELEKLKIEQIKENLSNIAEKTMDNLEEENKGHADELDETTTPCPEELEKQKLEKTEENTNIIYKEALGNLEEESTFFKTVEQTDELDHQSNEITTICPEEIEKAKLQKIEQNLDVAEKTAGDLEEGNELSKPVEYAGELDETREITTICPEELEKQKLEKIKENLNIVDEKWDSLENDELHKSVETTDESGTTTICPEELARRQQEKNKENLKKIPDNADNLQKNYDFVKTVDHDATLDLFKETFDDSTFSPKDLTRRKLEQSQKYLTKFNELVSKAQKRKTSRRKRQATDYSSYYPNQPTYDTQGEAAASSTNTGINQQQSYNPQGYNLQPQAGLSAIQNQQSYKSQGYTSQNYNPQPSKTSANQNHQTYKPQGYTSQNYNPQPIKTYQQIRKQYQPANTFQKNANFYPKTYQNQLKPVKTYRNPSFVRFPSNGSLKNYYRLNNLGNRRQFQGARPFATRSTSTRPNVRVTRKKKFKPSPVFA